MYIEEDMSDSDDFEPPKVAGRSSRKPVSQCSLQTSLDTSAASSTVHQPKLEATSQESTSSTSSFRAKAKGKFHVWFG